MRGAKRTGLRREFHGMSKTIEYRRWSGMITRCTNPNRDNFYKYGGRGIKVCRVWMRSFIAFYEHIGPAPSPLHTVERIRNGDGYRPGNVKWATPTEQGRNKRNNVLITVSGRTAPASQWAEETGISPFTLYDRSRHGVPEELMLHNGSLRGLL